MRASRPGNRVFVAQSSVATLEEEALEAGSTSQGSERQREEALAENTAPLRRQEALMAETIRDEHRAAALPRRQPRAPRR